MMNQTTRLVHFAGWIVITVAALGFIWVLYRHEFDPDDNQTYAPNTCARALELRLADDNQHFTTRIFQDGTLRKTVRLEICNIGNGFLSNCFLTIDDITPIPKFSFHAVTLMAEVTIRINESQFVPVIEFNEIIPQGTKSSEDAFNLFPAILAAGGRGFTSTVKLNDGNPENRWVLRVSAGARECETVTAHVHVSVELPSRKLHAVMT